MQIAKVTIKCLHDQRKCRITCFMKVKKCGGKLTFRIQRVKKFLLDVLLVQMHQVFFVLFLLKDSQFDKSHVSWTCVIFYFCSNIAMNSCFNVLSVIEYKYAILWNHRNKDKTAHTECISSVVYY